MFHLHKNKEVYEISWPQVSNLTLISLIFTAITSNLVDSRDLYHHSLYMSPMSAALLWFILREMTFVQAQIRNALLFFAYPPSQFSAAIFCAKLFCVLCKCMRLPVVFQHYTGPLCQRNRTEVAYSTGAPGAATCFMTV